MPPTVAEHVRRAGLRLVYRELVSVLGYSQASRGSSFTTFPWSPVHQLNKVKGLRTHLVTLLSTFTRGTRRARKSLEARMTWISKEGSLAPRPPGGRRTGQTQRRWQLGPGTGSHTLAPHERSGLATLSTCPESSGYGKGMHGESGPATYLEP